MRACVAAICSALALVGCANSTWAAGLKAVVFDIEPVEMPKTAETKARLDAASALVRKLLSDKGFVILDTAPQAGKIAANLPLSQCNGCDGDIAKALGADIEVATAMHAASAVSFNLSGSIKDVTSDKVLRQGVVNINGEGGDEWAHGVKFLVKERLLDPPLPADATP